MSAIPQLEAEAMQAIAATASTADLKSVEAQFLGKSGSIMKLMTLIPTLPNEEKPAFGKLVNECRARVEEAVSQRHATLLEKERFQQFQAEQIDITMPSRRFAPGYAHVLWQTEMKIKRVLGSMGFQYFDAGKELEVARFNFEKLNYPADHPAMDEQDTFYISDDRLLRTQCTSFQGRILDIDKVQPPMRWFTIGRTFRNEAVDRTHSHTFHQVDCFMIDEGVSMAHLKGTLRRFASLMFGLDAQVRFRPDFFPFVEPGVDYAVSTSKLFNGRWLELGGAGLIHPKILEAHDIDTERYSGFAFGLGVERIPMMAYGVDDLRHFLENDLRFLEQFA